MTTTGEGQGLLGESGLHAELPYDPTENGLKVVRGHDLQDRALQRILLQHIF
jgi:hypothetical protein